MFRVPVHGGPYQELRLRRRQAPAGDGAPVPWRDDPFIGSALSAAFNGLELDRLRRLLVDIGEAAVWRMSNEDVRRRAMAALEAGRLELVAYVPGPSIPRPPPVEEAPPAPVQPPPTAPPAEEPHWIEIVLLGEDEEPLPGFRWRIELPDGEVREGKLDKRGRARLDDIPGGTCRVCFPELDQDAWEVNTRPPPHVAGGAAR